MSRASTSRHEGLRERLYDPRPPAPRHAIAVATVREFAGRAGAARVVLLLDEGAGAPATMLEWRDGEPLELTEAGLTHQVHADAVPGVPPAAFPDVRPAPPSALAIDAETGELSAPLGVVANLAEAVLGLAAVFGGRSVVTAEFPTRDADRPLTIAVRPGEPVVAALGDQLYAFPDDWP